MAPTSTTPAAPYAVFPVDRPIVIPPAAIVRDIGTGELHVFACDEDAERWRRSREAFMACANTERVEFVWHGAGVAE